jgi:methyl coenzyme M reductase subunit D
LIPKTGKFVYFDNASFPGSFIIAVNHYVKTQTNIQDFKWYGSSIINCEDFGDEFELMKNYPTNWLMNPKNNGDITDINNIKDIQRQLVINGDRIVDFYSCDLGKGCGDNYNDQETIHFNTSICQILCGLNVLKKNGNMIIKHYTIFEPFTVSYLSLLTMLFDEMYITKPITSKRTNSEIYIVCKGYRLQHDIHSVESRIIRLMNECVGNEKTPFIASDFIYDQICDIQIACNIFKKQSEELSKFIYIAINAKYNSANNKHFRNIILENQKRVNTFHKIVIKHIKESDRLSMITKY